MSGDFREEQNATIEATDDAELAKRHGLTRFDKATGQWRAPSAPDAGERDGAEVHEAEHAAADAEGAEQQAAEQQAESDESSAEKPAATPAKKTAAAKK